MEKRQKDISILVDHFFRHESGKMVSVLTKIFGSQNLDLAEDVVQDSLIETMEHWQYHAVPDNPSVWLFRVAVELAPLQSIRDLLRKKIHFCEEKISDDQ